MNGPTLFDTISTCPFVREMGHHLRVNTPLGSDSEAFRCAGCFFAVCFECGVREVDLWGTACPSCEEFITESRRWMAEWDRLGLFDMEVHASQPKSLRGQVADLVATYARQSDQEVPT